MGTRVTAAGAVQFAAALLLGGVCHAEVPSSPRSREAVSRVEPRLISELRSRGLTLGSPLFVRIFKDEEELEVWIKHLRTYKLFKTYRICTFSGDLGPKLREGDRQSPEGFYEVRPLQLNPSSAYHLSFNLGFPNRYDRANGRTGSALMVHGSCVSIGCYAMGDRSIEEIYALADAAFRAGHPKFDVHIFPFRPTAPNMRRHRGSRWFTFWSDMKVAYDLFERHRRTPLIDVRNRRYVITMNAVR
jgi:murein L,D-transpeptidase YafK